MPAAVPPPAARPAPGSGASRIQWDRVGRIALSLVLLAVLYSYLNPVIDLVKTYTATTAAKADLHEELAENKRLHWRVQHSDDPIVLDAKARGQGMVGPARRPYVDPRPRPLAARRIASGHDRRRLLPSQRRRPGGPRPPPRLQRLPPPARLIPDWTAPPPVSSRRSRPSPS